MNRPKWGWDMDETLSPFIYEVVKAYNRTYRKDLNYYDIDQYDITPFIVPECKNIWQEFCTDRFIRELIVEPTAVETLCKLNETYDIYFVTAGHPNTMKARDQWLAAHFPFYKSSMLIASREKQMIKLNYLTDDFEGNLVGGDYRGFLVNRPWNRKFDAEAHGITRISFAEDVLKYI